MELIKKKISIFVKFLTLIVYYSKRLRFLKKSKKQIIICFDGNFPHGGLVDRLKGIISFYEISKILNFEFKIFFKHPFELEEFLLPHEIDWTIDEKELNYTVFSTKILYLVNNFKINPLELIKNTNATTIIVYCNVDYIPTLYPDKNKKEWDRIWRNNYLELFKVSKWFRSKLDFLPMQSRIVFHTRFTTLMGDFLDSTKLILNDVDRNILIQKVIRCIDDLVLLYPNKEVYILSDSYFFLEFINNDTLYKTLEGIPKHIESRNNDIKFHLKTFLDFYFLIESDEIYFVRINEMYNSSFSKYASIIGNKSFIKMP